jgi:mannose-6-phosphate isomerase-like protein (cupin superfamily)
LASATQSAFLCVTSIQLFITRPALGLKGSPIPSAMSAATRSSVSFRMKRPCDDIPNDLPFSMSPRIAPDLLSIKEKPRVRAKASATGTKRGSAPSIGAEFLFTDLFAGTTPFYQRWCVSCDSRTARYLCAMPSFDLASTYVCLSPSGSASTIEVTSEFWTTIDERSDLADGRLVAAFRCDADWPHWEMHPHGEEILVLLSGKLAMVFDEGGKERNVALEEGRACIVPRGTWHRAIVHVPGTLLGITYGRGTQHRDR